MERQVGVGDFPDNGALQAGLLAAAQLLHRHVDVVHRDGRDADQPVRAHLAVVHQPIVVDLEAGFL